MDGFITVRTIFVQVLREVSMRDLFRTGSDQRCVCTVDVKANTRRGFNFYIRAVLLTSLTAARRKLPLHQLYSSSRITEPLAPWHHLQRVIQHNSRRTELLHGATDSGRYPKSYTVYVLASANNSQGTAASCRSEQRIKKLFLRSRRTPSDI